MQTQEFTKAIERTYHSYFPSSAISVTFHSSLYRSIWITCYLAGNKEELSGKIWGNDILNISFSIESDSGEFSRDVTLESELPENLVLEVEHKSYAIKPETHNMAYGKRKLSFRKMQGNATKLLQVFDKYFAQLKESLTIDLASNVISEGYHKNTVIKALS